MTDRKQANPWAATLEGLVRSVRAVVDAQRRMAGTTRTGEVGEAYVRFLRSELLPYGRTIANLTVDYYRALAEEAQAYSGRFYDEVLGRDGFEEGTRTDSGLEDPAIFLVGPSGSEVVTAFTLENHDPTPAHVILEAGACRDPDGRTFSAPISIEPSSVVIATGQTVPVRLRLRLLPELFTPGATYRVPLKVQGPRPATMDLTIRALASSESRETVTGEAQGPHVIECPTCGRTFSRKTTDVRLRPHKGIDGVDCLQRVGRRRSVL